MVIPLSLNIVNTVGTVIITIFLILSNIITFMALNSGTAAFFGWRMASKQGYSLAVCGFQQASSFFKTSFTGSLSLNSPCRKLLGRIGIVWIILALMKIITPFGAIGLKKDYLRADEGTVSCIEYGQKNVPVDRRWPNVQSSEYYPFIGSADLF